MALAQLRGAPLPSTSALRQPAPSQAAAWPCTTAGPRLCRSRRPLICTAVATMEPLEAQRDIPDMGRDLWNRSYYPTGLDAAALHKDWFIVDATGQTLGRLAVLVSTYIRGKHRPTYTPSVDMGGFVVVINAEKVIVTGSKASQKLYKRHTTGRPGSMKEETFAQLQARIPERIIEKAVKGMLPRGRLGNNLFRHLKVYDGPSHPHTAQQPQDITNQINLGPKAAAAAR